jgi:hypothetical protein
MSRPGNTRAMSSSNITNNGNRVLERKLAIVTVRTDPSIHQTHHLTSSSPGRFPRHRCRHQRKPRQQRLQPHPKLHLGQLGQNHPRPGLLPRIQTRHHLSSRPSRPRNRDRPGAYHRHREIPPFPPQIRRPANRHHRQQRRCGIEIPSGRLQDGRVRAVVQC